LRNAFLWLWGGFSGASWTTVLVMVVYAPLPLAVLAAAARPLDLLALGEEPAQYLGADVRRLKRLVYLAASLLTAAAVAVAGVIGFVGLGVPLPGRPARHSAGRLARGARGRVPRRARAQRQRQDDAGAHGARPRPTGRRPRGHPGAPGERLVPPRAGEGGRGPPAARGQPVP